MAEGPPSTYTGTTPLTESQRDTLLTQQASIFASTDPSKHASQWNEFWQKGRLLWDRGVPSPALVDTLDEKKDILSTPTNFLPVTEEPVAAKPSRKKALVPGCGRGYDVLLLAAFGYDAVGLDASEKAMDEAKEWAKAHGNDQEYAVRDPEVGRGTARFVKGDFFSDDWKIGILGEAEEGFDLIYDYTFLCALPPELRPKWSKRESELLAPSGNLICLEFPLNKDPKTGGPPWALTSETYEALLSNPGEEPMYDDDRFVKKDGRAPGEGALVRIAHWQPERTHAVGQGIDWISVWRHR